MTARDPQTGRFIRLVPAATPSPRSSYDPLDDREKRRRRTPAIEMGAGEEDVLHGYKRFQSVSMLRDLYRNYTQAKSMLWQLRIHVIGQKVMFHTADQAWNDAAENYINSVWAKDCDGRSDRHLDDLNAATLMSVIREHDCLGFYDAAGAIPDGRGKLFFWESDQITNIESFDSKPSIRQEVARRLGLPRDMALSCVEGVIADAYGIERGYVVTQTRGQTAVKLDQCTILARKMWGDLAAGPDLDGLPAVGLARLFKSTWRHNQKRGVAELITAAANLVDAYEMLGAELLSAKTAAHFALAITKEDPLSEALGRAEAGSSSSEITVESTAASAYTRYPNFEKLSAGAIEYLAQGDKAEILRNDRPAAAVKEFIEWESIGAGSSLGLARFNSLLKADASYSAVRGEDNITWDTYEYWQTWAERYCLDWEVRNAVFTGIARGYIPQLPMPEWKFSFIHPKRKEIDQLKTEKANTEALINNTSTLRDLVGPRWREKVQQRAEEVALLRELGLAAPGQDNTSFAAGSQDSTTDDQNTDE